MKKGKSIAGRRSPVGPPQVGENTTISLRQKAEAHFREREDLSQEKISALSHEEMGTILHELRVHQIQLEMQNEGLRAAQADLDALQMHYFDLFDLAPVGYVTVSEPGLILEANLTATTLLGAERSALVGQPLSRFILKEDNDIFYLLKNKVLETGWPTCDLRMLKRDGSTFWAHLKKVSARDKLTEPDCRFVFSDITWRKQAEEKSREQEAHLEAILEAAADGILAVDIKGKVIRASRRFSEIWRIPESLMKSGDDKALLDFALTQLSNPDAFLKKVQALYDSDAKSFDTFTFKDGRVIERYSFSMIMGGNPHWSCVVFPRRHRAHAGSGRALPEERRDHELHQRDLARSQKPAGDDQDVPRLPG